MIRRPRVIPVLLLSGDGLVKTVRFDKPTYIGDPINAMKIFNDSEVDELILLDITSGRNGQGPQMERLAEIISEAFMPVCYGGAIREFSQAEKLFSLGVEKLSFNTATLDKPELLTQVARAYGNQSVVAAIDVKKNFWGRPDVVVESGKRSAKMSPVDFAKSMVDRGAGEILLNSVDRDGTSSGYDLELIANVSEAVQVPVIACGGAGELQDFHRAVVAGASAVAAGSLFVFHGKLRGVLINYPTQYQLKELFRAPSLGNFGRES
jgi:cyclase